MFKYPTRNQMRVVAGKAKGRRLRGTVSPGARPTTERVRAAIFNILLPQLYQNGRALDLFAGSGSLGIEALSRGVDSADFVEQDRRQCAVIRANLEHTGFQDRGRVFCGTVDSTLNKLEGHYKLVLMDPPYRMEDLESVLEGIAAAPNLVDDGGMVVVGHSSRLSLRPDFGSLQLVSSRRYGDNAVEFYSKEAGKN